MSKKIVIIVLIILILGVVGIVMVQKNNKPLPASSQKTPASSSESATPNPGPVLGIWGLITRIDTTKAVLAIKSDAGKEYPVEVGTKVKVNKYQGSTQKDPPRLLTDKANWQDLKENDRVYIMTTVDLGKESKINADQVISLDWYLNSTP